MDELENLQSVESFNEELFEHFKVVADKGQSPLRIDKFLMNFLENATRNKIQQAAKAGNLWVNGVPVKQNYRVKPLDEVALLLAHPPRILELIPENIPLNILYEDENLLIVNKPPGLVVHPGHGNYHGTLVNALLYHFQQHSFFAKDLEGRPGLVHRIDKDTSGLMVIAKDEFSMNHLAKQFFNRTVERTYYALIWGTPEPPEGIIEGHIDRHPKDRMQMAVFPDGSKGKPAKTAYKIIESFRYVSLIECKLFTGRTHQIRAHMKHIGHPLFNDERYGGNQILKGTTFSKYQQFVQNCFKILPRQALHAKTLGFIHPVTKKEMFFDSDLPEDMAECINKWRNYVTN